MSSSVLPALCTHTPISSCLCDYKRLHRLFYYFEDDKQSMVHRLQQGDFINKWFNLEGGVSNFWHADVININCINIGSGRKNVGLLTHVIGYRPLKKKSNVLTILRKIYILICLNIY